MCALLPSAMGYARPQQQSSQASAAGNLQGRVLDALHRPVRGAVVSLKTENAVAVAETVTDASGTFSFSSIRDGTYMMSAGDPGARGQATSLVRIGDAPQNVDLILHVGPGGDASPGALRVEPPDNQALEFSDKPTFTVEGLTDWTAVGGHGSDATLRTSEQLAQETLALKTRGTDKTPATDRDESEVQLRAALTEAPLSYAANHELGEYYLRAMQYQKALPLLEAASEINHAQSQDEYALALACRGIGDLKKARLHVEQALAQKESADEHRLAGELDEKLGDSLAAVEQEQRAVRLDPSEENYFAWGSELLFHRAIWQAAEVFKLGVHAHPASARMLSGWGSALFAGALYDEAAQRLCEASDLDPSAAEPYLFMGRIDAAAPAPLPCVEQRLDRFVHAQPGNATANYLYAMALNKRGDKADLAKIEALLSNAVHLDHSYAEAYLYLGILSFAQHEDAKAIDYYLQAVEADASLSEVHYRLAIAYKHTGDRAKAAQEFALHNALEKRQADSVEQQRREIKQFEIKQFQVLQGQPADSPKP